MPTIEAEQGNGSRGIAAIPNELDHRSVWRCFRRIERQAEQWSRSSKTGAGRSCLFHRRGTAASGRRRELPQADA